MWILGLILIMVECRDLFFRSLLDSFKIGLDPLLERYLSRNIWKGFSDELRLGEPQAQDVGLVNVAKISRFFL